jgi:hypothetical protein
MRLARTFPLAVVLASSTAQAERNLMPMIDSQFDVCTDRPPQPDWLTNTDTRGANEARLIQQIYRVQSMARIVEAGECSCETRFPSWEAAEQSFFDQFASSDRNELREAISEYSRTANELRLSAKPICEAESNW